MTTVSPEMSPGAIAPVYVVRSTDLRRPEAFRDLSDAVRFCRHLGLPYYVNHR
jgi:hypothetical protein